MLVHKINSPFGGYYPYPENPKSTYSRIVESNQGSKLEGAGDLAPLVDVYEDDAAYYASLVMPGVEKQCIQVKYSNRTLTVNAEVKRMEHKDGHWVLQERNVGTYIRSIELRSAVDSDAIEAIYVNGILNLTIPKAPSTHKPISINVV